MIFDQKNLCIWATRYGDRMATWPCTKAELLKCVIVFFDKENFRCWSILSSKHCYIAFFTLTRVYLDVHPWLQISVLRILGGSLRCFQKDRIEGCFQDGRFDDVSFKKNPGVQLFYLGITILHGDDLSYCAIISYLPSFPIIFSNMTPKKHVGRCTIYGA